jgi:hypothetical protein
MKFLEFTPEAREKLDSLPKGSLKNILSNCLCPHCKKEAKWKLNQRELFSAICSFQEFARCVAEK